MATPAPELIFLSGPQAGERVVLLQPVMIAGRSGDCDVHLADEHASRQHVRFQMTPDGCMLEILSPRGALVSGRKYKAGQRLLLETGDCLGVGTKTAILFVSAGDDPDAALSAWRNAHPRRAAPKKESPPAAAPPADVPVLVEAASPVAALAGPPALPQTPEELAAVKKAQDRRKKVRRYLLLGGVYAAAIIGLVVFLQTRTKDGGAGGGRPGALRDREIAEAIREPLVRSLSENIGVEELRKAQALFPGRNFPLGRLQKCVKSYKLHLACMNKQDFDLVADSKDYGNARDELIAQVQTAYKEALLREDAKRWASANQKWEELRRILPHDPEWDSDGYKRLVKHIMDHASFTNQNMPKRR